MPANECIPVHEPGARITARASADVTGGRLLKISGNRGTDKALAVNHCTNAAKAFGVASHDAKSGELVTVLTGPGLVVPIPCTADITAYAEVEAVTNGQVVTKTSGVAIGYVLTGATSGGLALVKLY